MPFLNGEASAGAGINTGIFKGGAALKGGRNQSWTDSDIGIASEDRSRIMGSLTQISDSRNKGHPGKVKSNRAQIFFLALATIPEKQCIRPNI